jgi:hypothetical protein
MENMVSEVYEFYVGHVIDQRFLGICRRTMYRWLAAGKITSFKDISGRHKFTLQEINRVRVLQGKTRLSKQEAYRAWEELYASK